jgi:hypothetical protein
MEEGDDGELSRFLPFLPPPFPPIQNNYGEFQYR